MKELIISNYDSGTRFKAVIINNCIVEREIYTEQEMKYFGLLDTDYIFSTERNINKNNETIQQFDRIICCYDGDLNIYAKGVDY